MSPVKVTWNHDNGEEASKGILNAVEALGQPVYVYKDPSCEGSDCFGVVISGCRMTSGQVEEYVDNY